MRWSRGLLKGVQGTAWVGAALVLVVVERYGERWPQHDRVSYSLADAIFLETQIWISAFDDQTVYECQ